VLSTGWKYYMKRVIPLILLTSLTGCVNADLRALRNAPPPSDPYLEALSSHYLAFAESEARAYDWVDAMHFTDKGLKVVYGHEVLPDNPKDRKITGSVVNEMDDARSVLIAKLNSDARQRVPAVMARAAYFYDCWLEQQEEGWQQEDIDACRNGYYAAMDTLEHPNASPRAKASVPVVAPVVQKKSEKKEAVAPKAQVAPIVPLTHKTPVKQDVKKVATPIVVAPVTSNVPVKPIAKEQVKKAQEISPKEKIKAEKVKVAPVKKATDNKPAQPDADKPESLKVQEQAPKPQAVIEPKSEVSTGRVVVYYKPTSGELYTNSYQTLMQSLKKLKGKTGYRITLHGYASGEAASKDNLRNSYMRASQLKKALVAQGLKAENIHVFAFGDKQHAAGASSDKQQKVEMLIE
jgi:outer membrane protein OmpA-like peptidoglycan-associated protein